MNKMAPCGAWCTVHIFWHLTWNSSIACFALRIISLWLIEFNKNLHASFPSMQTLFSKKSPVMAPLLISSFKFHKLTSLQGAFSSSQYVLLFEFKTFEFPTGRFSEIWFQCTENLNKSSPCEAAFSCVTSPPSFIYFFYFKGIQTWNRQCFFLCLI